MLLTPACFIEQLSFLDFRNPHDRISTQTASTEGNWKPSAAYNEAERAEVDAEVAERLQGCAAFMQTDWARCLTRRDISRKAVP